MTKLIATGSTAILASSVIGARAVYSHSVASSLSLPKVFDPANPPSVLVSEKEAFVVGLQLAYIDEKTKKTAYSETVASEIVADATSESLVPITESRAYSVLDDDKKQKSLTQAKFFLRYLEASGRKIVRQTENGPVELQETSQEDFENNEKRVALLRKKFDTQLSTEFKIEEVDASIAPLLTKAFKSLVDSWNASNK